MASFESAAAIMSVIVGCSIGAFLAFKEGRQAKAKREKHMAEFIETVDAAIENGTISALDDVTSLYRAVTGKSDESSASKRYIIQWLEKSILQQHKIKSTDDEQRTEIKSKIELLKKWLREILEQEPFSDLPDAERNLMTDVLVFGKKSDQLSFISKLHDLSHVIKTRYQENNKLRETTKWSVPLSIAGLIASIGFGLYTIFKV